MNTCRILQRLVGLARIELATIEFHHPEPSTPWCEWFIVSELKTYHEKRSLQRCFRFYL